MPIHAGELHNTFQALGYLKPKHLTFENSLIVLKVHCAQMATMTQLYCETCCHFYLVTRSAKSCSLRNGRFHIHNCKMTLTVVKWILGKYRNRKIVGIHKSMF